MFFYEQYIFVAQNLNFVLVYSWKLFNICGASIEENVFSFLTGSLTGIKTNPQGQSSMNWK